MDGTGPQLIGFTLNGQSVDVSAAPGERLSATLRERLGARDVKIGCNAGDCGACTVLVDGESTCACLMSTAQIEGRKVETLAGLAQNDADTKALAEAFQNHGAAQCGICTPGMMVAATAYLRNKDSSIEDALGGVLCRCTGYRKIIDAVTEAAGGGAVALHGTGALGTSIRRLDGVDKVEGRESFGDDVAPIGTAVVHVIRSPFPRASFEFGDLEGFETHTDGVLAVLTAADIKGRNCFGVIAPFADQPVFAVAETRFRGEAVAAVVGTPELMARFHDGDFPVRWSELPAVMTPDAAMKPDAPQLHSGRSGNIMTSGFVQCGDADRALGTAEHRATGQFDTAFVEHGYIEPEAGYATVNGDRVEIHACTQAPVMDLDSLEEILAMDRSRIRIVPTAVGGGFGSKLDISVQPYLALAALKTGGPVRITYSRGESMQSTTKRHPAQMQVSIGADAQGHLQGFRFDGVFNTGAYASWGPTVANRVPVHASGPYRVKDYRAEAVGVHTHCPPSGAFRGFGVPQAAIAQEVLFDELAQKLGMDPLAFRELNALENGMPTVCGQVFEQGVGIKACFTALRGPWADALADAAEFNAKAGAIRRGVGIAAGWYGCGNTSLPNPSTIKSGVQADGQIVLHQGAMDIGQGANTVISQIFAQALGCDVHRLKLIGADTDVTPDAGKTSASRQTFVSGNAARLSGLALRADILRRCNIDSAAAVIEAGDGVIIVRDGAEVHEVSLNGLPADADGYVLRAQESYDPPTKPLDKNGQGVPYAQFGYAAHLAVVDVDMQLGTVHPVRFVAAHDVGHAINPMLVEGQVHGGIAQGLGMALMEEFIPGRTENLHDYLMPTIGDIPPIETLIIEEPDAHGPYGAKGLGEHVLIPTAPALINAINRAAGVQMRRVPVTPARLRAAIQETGHD
ncbi:molybdopterin cofactor-binding domain-containing protein [Roseobacter sp. N2S]|uniref:molybdopterin-dependent oxidoreductase n=1 Tax=Roseobacter sp. N2S TaxID=2663844 RepID=UPI002860403A|nr:molybdopterin cofactor-binding domain-containing protein [Roseobacter sp. N2S]MDR6264183.1 CO/xanthine dehydrogenase Mo-binding subunit/aerobic-type carbon monoxide dehydrogenase small subunit (CoxS/CutS family) [Roseobacter sp. N2S]